MFLLQLSIKLAMCRVVSVKQVSHSPNIEMHRTSHSATRVKNSARAADIVKIAAGRKHSDSWLRSNHNNGLFFFDPPPPLLGDTPTSTDKRKQRFLPFLSSGNDRLVFFHKTRRKSEKSEARPTAAIMHKGTNYTERLFTIQLAIFLVN